MTDLAYPLNRSEIVCWIDEGTCEDSMIHISGPSFAPSTESTSSYYVHSAKDTYQITSWEGGILDAASTTACRRVRLTINTLTKQVTQIAEDLDPQGCEIAGTGVRLDPIVGVRVATLVDTWNAQSAYRKSMEDRVNEASGPLRQKLSSSLPN